MYDEKLFLTPQEIYDKQFKTDTMGYRPQEVDKYLDMVIRDYTEFINIIKRLQTENAQLKEDREKLRVDNIKMRNIIDSANSSTSSGGSSINYNNVDLLKRISNLEKTVYGKDE